MLVIPSKVACSVQEISAKLRAQSNQQFTRGEIAVKSETEWASFSGKKPLLQLVNKMSITIFFSIKL